MIDDTINDGKTIAGCGKDVVLCATASSGSWVRAAWAPCGWQEWCFAEVGLGSNRHWETVVS